MSEREFPTVPLMGVGAVVVLFGRVLVIRRATEPMKGHWSLPGGLVELGETLDEAVVREVREETGLEVEPIELIELLDRIYREGERAERGEATLDEAAEALAVSPATVRRLILEGALPASQHCKGAPWVIRNADLQSADVAQAAARRRQRSTPRPPSQNQPMLPFEYQ